MATSIRDRFSEELVEGFDKSTAVIGQHTSDILGESLGGVIDDIKGLAGSTKDFMVGGFNTLFGKSDDPLLDETEEQTGLLNDILNHFIKENLEDKRKFDDEGKNGIGVFILGIFGMIATAVGFVLGSIIGVILLPFITIGKALKPLIPIAKWFGGWINVIWKGLKSLPKIGNLFTSIGKFGGWLKSLDTGFIKLLGKSRLLGKFVIAKGFSKLAWPLTILIGLFDFFWAFFRTQGNIIDKLKSGLVALVTGFLELPIKLFGWIADWILEKFGIQLEGGVAGKMMKGISWFITNIIDLVVWWYSTLIDTIKSAFTNYISAFTDSFKILFNDSDDNLIVKIKNIFLLLKDKIFGWVTGLVDKINPLKWFKKDKIPEANGISSNEANETFADVQKTNVLIKKREEEKNNEAERIRREKEYKNTKNTNKKSNEAMKQINTSIITQSNENKNTSEYIPDESEMLGLVLMNRPSMGENW